MIDENTRIPVAYEVIATQHGFTIRFRDAEALCFVAEHLTGLLEAVDAGKLGEPPYLFATINENASAYMGAYGDFLKAERQLEASEPLSETAHG